MYYDFHAHLEEFGAADLNELRSGNVKVIANAVDMGSYNFALKEQKKNQNVHKVFIGIHPDRASGSRTEIMCNYIKNNPVDGIGEIGIDAKYGKVDVQKQVFSAFLDVAQEKKLPIAVHSRNSIVDILEILKDYRLKVMLHWFSGNKKQHSEAIQRGYFIGVTPAHTGKEKWIIGATPAEQLLLETDSPVFGRRPRDIPKLARKVSVIRGIELEEFIKQQGKNAIKFLGK